jgi:hypothetical protein
MICPNCGEEIPEGKAFCGKCGQALSILEESVPQPVPMSEKPPEPEIRAKALYLEAREHWSAGNLQQAEQAYREAIGLAPGLPHPHFDLACLLEAQVTARDDALTQYKWFVAVAEPELALAPQIEQARQRIAALEKEAAAEDTSDILESVRSQLLDSPSEADSSADVPARARVEADSIPTAAAPQTKGLDEALVAEVLVPKTEAVRSVRRGLEGTLIKKEQLDDDVRKVLLPLWRVRCRYKKSLLSRELVEEPVYLNAYNGRLMTLEKGAMHFTDIVEVKPHRVADLDNKARFERSRVAMAEGEPIPRKVSKEGAMQRVREMFRVEATDAEAVFLPLWQFSITAKRSGQRRWVFIDTTFGREVSGLSARTEPGAAQPFEQAAFRTTRSKPPEYSFPILDTALASVDAVRAVRDVAVGTATVAAGTAKVVGKVAVGTASTAVKGARAVKSAADSAKARSQARKADRPSSSKGKSWIKRLGCLLVIIAVVLFAFLVLGGGSF